MGKVSIKSEIDLDELFEEAVKFTIYVKEASASLLQRQFEIGYARAARLLDQLEVGGVISESDGIKPRKVLFPSYYGYLSSTNKNTVALSKAQLVPDWVSANLSGSPFSSFQTKHKKNDQVCIPIGLNGSGKIESLPISDIGGLLIYTNPICNSLLLLNLILEAVVGTYNPDIVKFIIYDDAGQLSVDRLRASLITPVIKPFEKLVNALKWALGEMESRNKMFLEVGAKNIEKYNRLPGYDPIPRIIIAMNDSSDFLSFSDEVMPALQRIISSGNSVGIHPIVLSPMNEKKTAKILTTIPSKIVFKTFSVSQADTLGTDDAFELSGPSEFIFIPPYGKVEKLSIKA